MYAVGEISADKKKQGNCIILGIRESLREKETMYQTR